MESVENRQPRSGLLPPGSMLKKPTPTSALLEISYSDNNARSAMPPPDRIPPKHKMSGLPEPQPKRKTLQERAAEPYNQSRVAQPTPRPVNPAMKAVAAAGPRVQSFTSSVTSNGTRPGSASSRVTSNSSFASSVGPGARPPSALSNSRPASALGHVLTLSKPSIRQVPQPESTEISEVEEYGHTQQKGKVPGSYISSKPLQVKKRATTGNLNSIYNGCAASEPPSYPNTSNALVPRSLRDISVSAALERFHISEDPFMENETSVVVYDNACRDLMPPPPKPTSPSKLPLASPRLNRLRHQQSLPAIPSSQFSHVPYTPTISTYQDFVNHCTPSPSKRRQSAQKQQPQQRLFYVDKYSNTQLPIVWDTTERLNDMEGAFKAFQTKIEEQLSQRKGLEEGIEMYKQRITELEAVRSQLSSTISGLQADLETTKLKLSTTEMKFDTIKDSLDDAKRSHANELDDLKRKFRNEEEDARSRQRLEADRIKREAQDEVEKARKVADGDLEKMLKAHRDELADLERRLRQEVEDERTKRIKEVQEISTQWALQRQNTEASIGDRERETQNVRHELQQVTAALETEKALNTNLQSKLTEAATNTLSLETSMRAMKAKIDFLESDNQAQSQAFADINTKLQQAEDAKNDAMIKLRAEETLRRKLHNQVQELKGNIRVFCRVRPTLSPETEEPAKITFPDTDAECKEVIVQGPEQKSALGNVTTQANAFSFDRVFGPTSQNADVFDEISQLVQSALDGYNVCIFCYGQTGSGKTYTMSTPSDGMIPRAVHQIYATARSLEEKGWTYTMEGQFVEVYNENLNDLLGKAEEFDKKKHEIRHDPVKCKTSITDVTTVVLDGPERVGDILRQAGENRSVAATKANERSSRSHSVFILKLAGRNPLTGETSEGTLNLVDLAGSERLSHSQATGERLKETQAINRSLSCLGDVISALGQQGKDGPTGGAQVGQGGHVPYRNSKLTYLLQYSLGGNSKTLMFVMVSPAKAHLGETLTSLKFATKVHNTHIGTAKRQSKVRD